VGGWRRQEKQRPHWWVEERSKEKGNTRHSTCPGAWQTARAHLYAWTLWEGQKRAYKVPTYVILWLFQVCLDILISPIKLLEASMFQVFSAIYRKNWSWHKTENRDKGGVMPRFQFQECSFSGKGKSLISTPSNQRSWVKYFPFLPCWRP